MTLKKPLSHYVKHYAYIAMAFIVSLLLFVLSLFVVLEATFLSPDYIMDSMNSSNYFVDKKTEITESMVDLGYASGLDEKFFSNMITEVMLSEDTQDYITNYYNGTAKRVDTVKFKQSFNEALDEYIEENSVTVSNRENLDFLIDSAATIYRNSLEIPLFARIADSLLSLKSLTPYLIAICVVGIIGLSLVIILTNKWKHRAIKYLFYGTAGAFLSVGLIPAIALITNYVSKINLASRALYNMFVYCVNNFFTAMIFCSVLFLLISVALLFWYKIKYKRLTE
jgi:hypothetical protein